MNARVRFGVGAILAAIVLWGATAFAQNTPTPTALRTPIAVETVGYQAGNVLTWQAAASIMKFQNGDGIMLMVRNRSASAVTLTVYSVAEPVLGRYGDITVSVPGVGTPTAAEVAPTVLVGPLRAAGFNQKSPNAGYVFVGFSATTSVDVAVVQVVP